MRYQPIYDIAELCVQKDIRQVVLCPGSRCAPLTLAFARHPHIVTRIFSDERSAGFVALGIAQATGRPVVIVCTSGTAVYNLAPAMAEAYFSQTPLIALTADRPAEWIAQLDGQTIYQTDIFGKHVKRSYQLPQDYEEADNRWAINRIMNEALNLSNQLPRGPVHVNAPFREPLYPPSSAAITFNSDLRVIGEQPALVVPDDAAKERIRTSWGGYRRILVVSGQQTADAGIVRALSAFQQRHGVTVLNDIISNTHEVTAAVQGADLFLGQIPSGAKPELQPDLLITFGQSLISKNLKIFLRTHPAREHWHVQPAGAVADTFRSLTGIFYSSPSAFFDFLSTLPESGASEMKAREAYLQRWRDARDKAAAALETFLEEEPLSELHVVAHLLGQLPDNASLHLANSMSVRYANFIGLHAKKRGIQVFSNRGTSGIDGCTSTAVGHALSSGRPNFLITGDLAFFYDRNAFWHNYPLENLRILLLNNHGGLIFDILDGPSALPEAREYFITGQALNARKLCEEFGFDHISIAEDQKDWKRAVETFAKMSNAGTAILEYESNTPRNREAFNRLKTKIKKSYES